MVIIKITIVILTLKYAFINNYKNKENKLW